MLKVCSTCNKKKQFPQDFNKARKKPDGSYYYNAKCKDCSKKYLREWRLKKGITKTPHGIPTKNLTNNKFGQLTVIEYHGILKRNNRNMHSWFCECDCGEQIIVEDSNLKSGGTQSCGCVNRLTGINNRRYKGYEEISGVYWLSIKRGAKERNLKFNITIKYIWDLFIQQNKKCAISKEELNFAKTSYDHNKGLTTASLDRIDNTKGYIESNVQWLHKKVNRMKWDLCQKDFIDLCKKIAASN